VIRALAVLTLVGLTLVGAAAASEEHPTLAELERETICPTCNTTVAMSRSPIADRMRAFMAERIAAGDTKSEIKAELVDQFGESVLAAPPKRGFNLLAWLLPIVCAALAAAALVLLAVRWRRGETEPAAVDPSANGRAALDPELERRLDEELARFEA
jgi:cytochrome c-type biogenesis protein CcmH